MPLKHGNHNRNGLPRVLFMSIQRELNRGPNAFELELIKSQEAVAKEIAKLMKQNVTTYLNGTGVAA